MTSEPIYLDHQATTPVDPRVIHAMARYWNTDFGNPHSSNHAFGWRVDDAVQEARKSVAELIRANAEEIVFTSGATEANNLAILGLLGHKKTVRTRVVVSAIEHKCVLQSSRQLSSLDYEIVAAPVHPSGHVDIDALESLIDENTALVSIMTVNNEIGSIQPLEKIGDLCRKAGAVFHSDAAQAPTAMAIDVDHLGVDLLSLSSHKLYGPKGIGALYVSQAVRSQLRPIIHGGGQEGGLRSGTLPVPLCVGFGVAARVLCDELPRDRLAISTGAACASGIPEPSYVLRAIGLTAQEAGECVRVGFGRFTEEEQARDGARVLAEALLRLKHI
jgi:cysteine desulfurase